MPIVQVLFFANHLQERDFINYGYIERFGFFEFRRSHVFSCEYHVGFL